MNTAPPHPYVFLAGMANSGSTLVAFLLNAHPEIVSVGEVDWVDRHLEERWRTGQGRCSCGQAYVDCAFWQSVREQGPAPGSPPFYSLWARTASEARLNAFTGAVLAASGKRVFLDASKKPDYLLALRRNKSLDLRVLNLLRDGEGVVQSWGKRSKASPGWLTRLWIWRERKRTWILRSIPAERVFHLQYEALANDPAPVLRRVFEFLGVDPDVDVISGYKSTVPHHIVGNPMRLDRSETIRSDPAWREKLDPALRAAFRRAGGPATNRKNGYPDV